jgi:protein TonB
MPATIRRTPLLVWQQPRRVGPLGLIILLHIGFFYALQSGLLRQAAQALPVEMFASFITPEAAPAPAPPKPQPAPPKIVPIVKKSVAPPPLPVVNTTPAPQAITAAPQAPSPTTAAEAAATTVAAPPAPATPASPKTISSGVDYIQPPQPEYPPLSRRMGEEGRIVLRVLVDAKGHPERVEVQKSSGLPRLDEAGRQAVLRALFRPHIDDGQAVAVYVIVPIKFQLNN